jgi:CRISPR-associated protein Cas2
MFVSVACEFSDDDHRKAVQELLKQYGFQEILSDFFESVKIIEKDLARLKRDIDRTTDYYDKIRIYQYPLEDTLIITSLVNKKWRRIVIKK